MSKIPIAGLASGRVYAAVAVVATMLVAVLLTGTATPLAIAIVAAFTAGVVLASAILHRLRRGSRPGGPTLQSWSIGTRDTSESESPGSTSAPGRAAATGQGRRVTVTTGTAVPLSASYLPLNVYLEHRLAWNVVMTFEQIESLLGFALPASARTEREWWTDQAGFVDGHANTWIALGRTAAPNLLARTVAFVRP